MAKYTSKLNLKKPEANDFYNVEDSNGNFDKIDEFASRTDNPHNVTKAQVGLGNVDNTSDKNKPISDAQASAINEAKSIATSAKTSADIHATSRNNPHNVTASQVGALSVNGGELNGNLIIKGDWFGLSLRNSNGTKRTIYELAPNGGLHLYAYTDENNSNRFSVFDESTNLSNAIMFYHKLNSIQKEYKIYGEHNLPYPSQIQTGSYVGNGASGSASPCKLEFNFQPKFLIIGFYYKIKDCSFRLELFRGMTQTEAISVNTSNEVKTNPVNVTWTDKGVEWYISSSTNPDWYQLNITGETYHYIAIG